MRRRPLLSASLAFALAGLATVGAGCSKPAPEQSQDGAALGAVTAAVTAATGYDASKLEVAAPGAQIMVKVINSPLAGRPAIEREGEAQRIASAISASIAGKPEFSGLLGIHVDYVTRNSDGGERVIDGVDFRKDSVGAFVPHIS